MRTPQFTIIPSAITDPFSFFKAIRQTGSHHSLLESLGQQDAEFSLYSFVGAFPAEALWVNDGSIYLTDLRTNSTKVVLSWLDILDSWTSVFTNDENNFGPLQTGVIGYIGYDMKYDFERLHRTIPKDTSIPDLFLVRYDAILGFDRITGFSHWAVNSGFENDCLNLEKSYLGQHESRSHTPFKMTSSIMEDFEKNAYLDSVNKTIEYIRNGDIFQANITVRFSANYSGDIIHLYETLRTTTPNPFFAFLNFPNPIISTSPERFFKVDSGKIVTCPIKGTVVCSLDGVDQRQALLDSEKDRAENIMITDLMRNDIGRVCQKGSVHVDELCAVKQFNSLYHLESIIRGNLKLNTKISDLLRATFPGGSITGAPKIRAMDIIEELETTRRGAYTGAIGFFGSDGWIDTSIAIRIVYFDNDRLYFHAGGGIVVDSTPENEYLEMIAKAEAIKKSLGMFNER
jgi:para-aminobenzoate synthetase component I